MNIPARVSADAPEMITAEELDRRFDDGQDISAYFDWSGIQPSGPMTHATAISLPEWMIRGLDMHAERHGVTRESLIATWLADRLKSADQSRPSS